MYAKAATWCKEKASVRTSESGRKKEKSRECGFGGRESLVVNFRFGAYRFDFVQVFSGSMNMREASQNRCVKWLPRKSPVQILSVIRERTHVLKLQAMLMRKNFVNNMFLNWDKHSVLLTVHNVTDANDDCLLCCVSPALHHVAIALLIIAFIQFIGSPLTVSGALNWWRWLS